MRCSQIEASYFSSFKWPYCFEVKNALFIAREIQQNEQIGLRQDTKKQHLMKI